MYAIVDAEIELAIEDGRVLESRAHGDGNGQQLGVGAGGIEGPQLLLEARTGLRRAQIQDAVGCQDGGRRARARDRLEVERGDTAAGAHLEEFRAAKAGGGGEIKLTVEHG